MRADLDKFLESISGFLGKAKMADTQQDKARYGVSVGLFEKKTTEMSSQTPEQLKSKKKVEESRKKKKIIFEVRRSEPG